MWFLQIDILIRILIGTIILAAASGVARKFGKQTAVPKWIVLLDLLVILYVSRRLLVFYVGYTLVTFALVRFIRIVKRGRKPLFLLCCLACAAPLVYTRAASFLDFLPKGLAMVGIAYNMLKAIDAVYFSYYTEKKIPLITYANFMLFVPVFTAGPIFRYRDFEKSMAKPEPITSALVERSVKRLIRGMFKKIVAAAVAVQIFDYLLTLQPHWYISLALMALSYLILYLDMAGYADMAIAIGGFMGIKVPENFKHPLKAASFTQFWRNWHVSLSDWIKEHIFVLLNGKRLSRKVAAAIGFGTMMFMSLWHGFTKLMVLDGIFNGILLAAENLLGLTTVDRKKSSRGYYIFRCVLTNVIFAFNTMFYTMTAEQLLSAIRGFIAF